MTTLVVLLRGINVGGHHKVPMADLKALCRSLDYENPRTVLASGNLVLETEQDAKTVCLALEAAIAQEFGFSVELLVLPAEKFRAIAQANPLVSDQRQSQWMAIAFVAAVPARTAQEIFLAAHRGPEIVAYGEDAVYLYYADGMGRSKLDLHKVLGKNGTVRNMNTVDKIKKLL